MIISKKLFLGFSVVICLAVIVGIMGITGMTRLREASDSVYESHVLGLEYAGKAATVFNQVRLHCRQIVVNSFYDDFWGAYDTKDKFSMRANEFRYLIERGKAVSVSEELDRFYIRILDIFENDYMPRAIILMDESIKDIPDHNNSLYVNALLESLIESGEQLEDVVIGSMDLNTALVQQANIDNDRFTSHLVMMQAGLLFVAVIAAAVIAIFITKSITVPINESAMVLSRVARGDFDARVNGKYKGELELIKNSVNETAAQLSVYLKEKVREEKNRSFAAILSIADAGILIKDSDGLVTEWNAGAEKILGYTRDEVIGKSTKYFTDSSLHDVIDLTLEKQKNGEHTDNTEDVNIHKDGRLITCSASHTPLFDESGTFNGSVVIFHDVTEKKLAEQEIRKFAAIVESADACIITTDRNFVIQGWNAGAENILGYSAEEVIGNTAIYYSPESEQDKIENIKKSMSAGERIEGLDVIRVHKNGTLVDCSVYYTPYYDEKGNFDGSVAVMHDISERKKMEKELQKALESAEEASKVKSTFLANMSHEIRTPMNAVISMTELLLEEKLTPKQYRYLQDINVSGTNLLGIINDILDLSKIESGKFEIVPVHFDFAQLIRNLYSTFEFMARDKELSFISDTQGELPLYLFGDDIRIRQILTNLLGNAVKFTSSGHVMLKTSADEHNIYFDISDTGMGIKEEDIVKLFTSFQQLDTAANRQKSGTGLGLPITKSLIEMMGGSINVESEYEVGTTFHVSIPRVDGDPKKLKTSVGNNAVTIHAPEALVLVVDDYEANLRVAVGLLELSGIKCDTASNGEIALDMVKKKRYDLVFMDHMMPGMDGVEVMQRIREMGYNKDALPIVALTANAISGVKEMLIEQGMNDFLSKPIDRVLLNEILLKWLPRSKVDVKEESNKETSSGKGKESSEIIRRLKSLPEIDVESALELTGGLEDLYESTFMITHRKLQENIANLDEYIDRESLKDFAIEIHGLKGALNGIGCRELGELANNLEKASKEENKKFCRDHYGDFKSSVMEFYEKTSKVIEDSHGEKRKEVDITLLRRCLGAARLACEEYDSFYAYEILRELSHYDFSKETDKLVEDALRATESCDYDEALDIILKLEKII